MDSGSYRLILFINKVIELEIGKLGIYRIPLGYYAYTGSAMRNLSKRIERHKRKDKKIKWHIDYLLDNDSVEIIDVFEYPSAMKEECRKNLELQNLPGSFIPVPGFGSSDCNICKSHLIGLDKQMPEFLKRD
jgi:sugar fermentation stimulation protein A